MSGDERWLGGRKRDGCGVVDGGRLMEGYGEFGLGVDIYCDGYGTGVNLMMNLNDLIFGDYWMIYC